MMATKKTAAKKATKKTAAKPKAMTTDDALRALREWREASRLDRYYDLSSPMPPATHFVCSVVRIDGWAHVTYMKRGITEVEAITKALAAAKKAGHA